MSDEKVTEYPTEYPQKKPRQKNPNWNSETGREAVMKRWSKQQFADRRKDFKQAVMAKLSPEELAVELASAMKEGDERKINCVIEVAKFMGCHFDQSEERVQNLSVKSDNKLEVTVKGIDG